MTPDQILAKQEPRVRIAIHTFEAMIRQNSGLDAGFAINARDVHRLFEIRQPFGLWWSRKLHCLKEFRDYVCGTDDTGKTVFVTADIAPTLALGNASKIGAVYSVLTTSRIVAMFPDRSPLDMMAEAQVWGEENDRLDRLFR